MHENINRNEFSFQIIDISSDDVVINPDISQYDKQFMITIYGKTNDNQNIVCNVSGFEPYFYMRIPESWKEPFLKTFLEEIIADVLPYNQRYYWKKNYLPDKLKIKRSYNFYGFNYSEDNNAVQKYKFAKICFDTNGNMNRFIRTIKKYHKDRYEKVMNNEMKVDKKISDWFNQDHNCQCVANLYETKITPLLRFIHEKDLETCGWVTVKIPKKHLQKYIVSEEDKLFNVDIEINDLPMKYINSNPSDQMAPFVTASFDIECDSSHGDFPNPIKDFKKVAIDIHETYFRQSMLHNPPEFKRKFIKDSLVSAFNNGSNDIQSIYTSNGTYSDESMKTIMSQITDDLLQRFDESKSNSKQRETMINELTDLFNTFENEEGDKIIIKGDPIIQIGTVFHRYGEEECYNRSIVVIGNDDDPVDQICDELDGIQVYPCCSEKDLLLKWKDIILYHNPDFITGYNIFGFDFDYINKRVNYLFPCKKDCKSYNCCISCPKNDFYRLGRLMRNGISDRIHDLENLSLPEKTSSSYNKYWEKRCKIASKELSSSGLGDNVLKYISMDGRIVFDIQKEIQKGHSLDSYKLDNVSSHFMKGSIQKHEKIIDRKKGYIITRIITNNIGNLKKGDYVCFNINTKYGLVKYENGKKFKIIGLNHPQKVVAIEGSINVKKYKNDFISCEWCLSKDDVSPHDIFEFHKTGGPSGRAKIAKYCIMDCELCIHLLLLLDLIPNNIGMANVSSVPLSYIFLRGQGIKISSLVTKECSKEGKNTRIPTLENHSDKIMDDGFEGAIVLEPTPGIYLDDPVSVLDYASLYPSSIIEKNLSHETFIGTKEEIDNDQEKYEELLKGVPHHIISYDDYSSELIGKTVHKKKAGTKTTCYFVKREHKKGIIPTILENLLDQRKNTRKRIKQTDDENKKKVLDGLQLAYKITANSVYGQMGAKTSSIFFKKIAACTTSIGRERIYDASKGVIEWADETGYHRPEVVYGDTDSVFVKFSRIHHETNIKLEGKEALQYCIDCGVKSGEWITKHKMNPDWNSEIDGKGPQDLEYEKTFHPFILISKKRYTGDKYELKSDKPKERTSMGIVMKRRDNAPIVKYVFGNVIEIIMNQKSVDLAIEWLHNTLKLIQNGTMDRSMFTISKSLRGYYKNPQGIAHKVLADRMAERNPGDKPKPNDRIPYVYIKLPDDQLYDYQNKYKSGVNKGKPRLKKILQGDRIEHPDFIQENNLNIDYSFYISNQIMNPVKQVLDLEKEESITQQLFNEFIE